MKAASLREGGSFKAGSVVVAKVVVVVVVIVVVLVVAVRVVLMLMLILMLMLMLTLSLSSLLLLLFLFLFLFFFLFLFLFLLFQGMCQTSTVVQVQCDHVAQMQHVVVPHDGLLLSSKMASMMVRRCGRWIPGATSEGMVAHAKMLRRSDCKAKPGRAGAAESARGGGGAARRRSKVAKIRSIQCAKSDTGLGGLNACRRLWSGSARRKCLVLPLPARLAAW